MLAWAESYEGQPFGALIIDPPYSSGGAMRSGRNQRTGLKSVRSDSKNRALADIAGDNPDQRSFVAWCTLWLGAAWRLRKPGAVALVFIDWRQLPVMTEAIQVGGWVWPGVTPWSKTCGPSRPQRGRFRAQCEYLVFATKGAHRPYDGAPCLDGMFEIAPPRRQTHITERPVELFRQVLPSRSSSTGRWPGVRS